MDLVIVRHSTSSDNHADLISGADSDVDLSSGGIKYAEKVRDAYDWGRFDVVYSSPLKRARQTAKILIGDDKPMTVDERLSEMHFGEWDGLSADPFRISHPDAFDYAGFFSAKYSDYAPKSESYAHLLARCSDFLESLKAAHASDAVLLVCHGFTVRALFAAALGIDTYDFTAPANIALNELHLDEADGFRPRILRYNQVLV